MWLTSVAIAGTLGAGVKVYRDKKREREKPWTVAAERMGLNALIKPPCRKKPALGSTFVVTFQEGAQKVIKPFKKFSIGVISSDERKQQLTQAALGDGGDRSQ